MTTRLLSKSMDQKRKRGWFRFSLRALLVGVLVLCIWLGWQVNRVHKQRRAVASVHELGGKVWFDYQVEKDPGSAAVLVHPNSRPPWPEWLLDAVGDDYFGNIVLVNLHETFADDSDLEMLAELPSVTRLALGSTRVTDRGIERLAQIAPQLTVLELQDTAITDAAMPHIGRMRDLESLGLWNTKITDEGAKHLGPLVKMRNLVLDGTQITDSALAHLAGMQSFDDWLGLCCKGITDHGLKDLVHLKNARTINLLHSRVSKQGGRWLSQQLPTVDVSY